MTLRKRASPFNTLRNWAKEQSSSKMYCTLADLGKEYVTILIDVLHAYRLGQKNYHPQRCTARVGTWAECAIILRDTLHAYRLGQKSNHPQRCTARVRTWAKSIQSHPQKMYCARVALSKEYAIILKDALHPYDLRQRAIVLKDVLHACERGQRVCNHPQRCTACVRTSEYTCTGTCLVEG